MRILFVENRYSTLLWQQAAIALCAEGHTVSWMVQNHAFTPTLPSVYKLPYPLRHELSEAPLDDELRSIALTDRALIHFNLKPTHYDHYRRRIHDLIDRIAPDVVFGEATQFHELLTLVYCKSLGIPYIVPGATRYPTGRLEFTLYDTRKPVGGSCVVPEAHVCGALLDDIIHRRVIPSYMEPSHFSWMSGLVRYREKLRIIDGWVSGERYITPSPWRRMMLNRAQRKARSGWDKLAAESGGMSRVPQNTHWVLYPLQLQPESNLDVYGQPWTNQRETMERAALSLAKIGAILVVKPNPKSKFEMTTELVNSAATHKNIVILPHDCPIGNVFRAAPMLLSVTGTVILESIFHGKPVAVLGSHSMTTLPSIMLLESPDDIADLLTLVEQGAASSASREEALSLLCRLYSTSYDALIWDPIARPDLFRKDIIDKLQAAFVEVVRQVSQIRPL